MADITLTVDVSSLADAKKKLDNFGQAVNKFSVLGLSRGVNTLQNNIRELVTAQQRGTISSSAYNLGLLQMKRAYEQMGLSSQAATAAVRRYAAELQRQDAAAIAAKAAAELAAANQRASQSYNQLRMSMDPVFAAQVRMKQAHDTIRAALAAGIITRTQAAQSLLQYRAALRAATAAGQQHALGLNKTAVLTQQAGYQFGDFFIQVQSGTNVLVAFGQQATQLVGTMAMLSTSTKMIAIFSGIGVLIAVGTAIGAAFMRASGASDTLATKLSKLTDVSSDLKENLRFLQQDDLGSTFGNMTTTVVGLTQAMLNLNSAAELRKLKTLLEGIKKEAEPTFFTKTLSMYAVSSIPSSTERSSAMTKVEDEAFKKLGLSMAKTQFDAYQDELMVLANKGDRSGVAELITKVYQDATDFGATADEVSEKGFALLVQLGKTALSLSETVALQSKSAEVQGMLNGGLSVAASIQKGILYDKTVELKLAKELKQVEQLVTEGLADPKKRLMIQQDYQRLLEAGVAPAQAMASAQKEVEAYLLESAIASGQLNDEQLVAAKAALELLDAVTSLEEKIQKSADITKLLEEGLSMSVIEAMNLAGVDFTKLSQAAIDAGVMATNLGISFGLASEIGKISSMSEADRKIYTGVKSGLLPEAALNSIGLGPTGFTRESGPIRMPGMMPDNPTTVSTRNGGGGGGSAAEATQTAVEKLQEQLELERELLGTSEAYQKVRQALGEEFKTTSPVVIAGLIEQANQIEHLTELENKRKEIMDTVKSSMEDAFMSMVDGTKSAKEAFKSMAAEIIKELYRVLVVQQLVNSVSGFLMPSKGPAGSVAPPPRPPGLATGGSMMPGRSYLVGENGPELVIPRHSGSVVNANQTANAMGGSGNFTQNLSINVTGSDATMVRTEVAKMIPQITNATKAAVIDARLRGGQMKQAFR